MEGTPRYQSLDYVQLVNHLLPHQSNPFYLIVYVLYLSNTFANLPHRWYKCWLLILYLYWLNCMVSIFMVTLLAIYHLYIYIKRILIHFSNNTQIITPLLYSTALRYDTCWLTESVNYKVHIPPINPFYQTQTSQWGFFFSCFYWKFTLLCVSVHSGKQ